MCAERSVEKHEEIYCKGFGSVAGLGFNRFRYRASGVLALRPFCTGELGLRSGIALGIWFVSTLGFGLRAFIGAGVRLGEGRG